MSSESLSRSEIDAKLRKLDKKLDELRRDYEQFFVGSRDRPPRNERREVERLVRELEKTQISNTSQQFRLRSLIQRFSSYRQKWNRIQRQIEEGTYRPHQQRAEKRVGEQDEDGETETESETEPREDDEPVVELDQDFDDIDLEGLERELDEMDQAGEFEEYAETDRLSASDFEEAERERARESDESTPSGGDARERADRSSGGTDDGEKRDKIRRMQEKLGISSGGDDSSRERERSGARGSDGRRDESNPSDAPASSDLPTGGADRDDLEKMRKNLRKSENQSRRDSSRSRKRTEDSGGNTRTSQRERSSSDERTERRRASRRSSDDDESSSSDDDEETHAERIYRRLISAKRERGEATEHLSLKSVRRSMARQREQFSEDHDPERIRFEVVVKEGKEGGVFLQPQLPD